MTRSFFFYLWHDVRFLEYLKLEYLVCVARHVQSTQNNKFLMSLQYLKEHVKDEVDFLPADKHQRVLQIDTIILGACDQVCPNYPK